MSATEIEAVVPTSTSADLPSGDPVPDSSAPVPAPKPEPLPSIPSSLPIAAYLAAAPSHADAFLAHLQRCLQTPSGIDTTLLFLCYGSRLGASLLESLLTRPAIHRSAQRFIAIAASLPPSATLVFAGKAALFPSQSALVAGALSAVKRLRALSGMLTEARTFLRLWGLLNMYFWLRRLVVKRWARRQQAKKADSESKEIEKSSGGVAEKDDDGIETAISWVQVTTGIVFQALENGAFLSAKGVLGWSPATQKKASLWSARFWAAFVGVEIGRLFYESRKRGRRSRAEKFGITTAPDGTSVQQKTAAEVQREEQEWSDTWAKSLTRNLAWAPLTVHWSTEGGLLSELAVGAIATVPGVIQMRDLWRRTAE
ncbi:uncharacterized protein GGS25DRAFT_144066 [Hypoxylon fragiforme]|uniref:uncharacterized protein n=1 Tax=Hypoxylon fragiforme TaxID=63214 RepID=UPI0020C64185|nr:uncharacterized protein GGS25DRAFT_144066 [Hypoxylon fragiforme]KAI2612967.1 hypothetical protein GGS25DRAFT_144066 [Hypoxylon fragiforme]